MASVESLRDVVEQRPEGVSLMIELSFPEDTPIKDVKKVGRRAIDHLFKWKPNGDPYSLGYQRPGFEHSYLQVGVVYEVRDQNPFEELSAVQQRDRELAAAHLIKSWANPTLAVEQL